MRLWSFERRYVNQVVVRDQNGFECLSHVTDIEKALRLAASGEEISDTTTNCLIESRCSMKGHLWVAFLFTLRISATRRLLLGTCNRGNTKLLPRSYLSSRETLRKFIRSNAATPSWPTPLLYRDS